MPIRKTKEQFIFDAIKIHGNKYDYSLVNYVNCMLKIKIVCPIHKIFEQRPNDHSNGIGCPICCESKSEKTIRCFLEKNNIDFEIQKKFKDCKNIRYLPFDFYLPKYNICIEFDGQQHFYMNEYFGGIIEFNKTIRRDKIKTNFCLNNNIQLIRIRYNEDVEKILKEKIPI